MMRFTPDEMMVILLYSPGNRLGLIQELNTMKQQLTPRERKLKNLTERVLEKLDRLTDEEFDALDFFPDDK